MLRNCNRSIAGRRILGTPNVGILAATIVAETASGDNGPGLLYDEALANAGKQLRAKITSYTGTPGKLFVFENGSILVEGESDGAYVIAYDVLADNVTIKSDTASVTVGSIHASAPGASLSGAGTLSAGSAAGQQNATAPGANLQGAGTLQPGAAAGQQTGTALGANLTGTSALQPGSATGQHNATAPGASLQGSSTLQPGTAAGGQSGDASAPGSSLSGSGTIQPGSATGQQSAAAPGANLQAAGSLQAGQAIGDRDAMAPGVDLSGEGSLIAGQPSQQSTPIPIITARAAACLNLRSGINPAMQTIIGNTARIAITVSDHNESPVDPSQLTIKILEPGQPVATATPVKDSAGQYHHDIRLTRPGKWYWRVETDGTPSAASEGQISVSPSRFS